MKSVREQLEGESSLADRFVAGFDGFKIEAHRARIQGDMVIIGPNKDGEFAGFKIEVIAGKNFVTSTKDKP